MNRNNTVLQIDKYLELYIFVKPVKQRSTSTNIRPKCQNQPQSTSQKMADKTLGQ